MFDMSEGAKTFSITTLSIMTFSIKGLFGTLSINGTQYNSTVYGMPLC